MEPGHENAKSASHKFHNHEFVFLDDEVILISIQMY